MSTRRLSAVRFVVVLLLFTGCDNAPMHGIVLDPASVAPPLALSGTSGGRFALASQRGHEVLVYFGYTHCPDVCPTVLASWARARKVLGADTALVRFVFVSVDPERDTPAGAQAYAMQFDSSFTGFAVTVTELGRIKRDWGIAAYVEGDPRTTDYSVAHPAHTFVVDARGRLKLMIPPGVSGEDLAQDLRRLR